MSHPRRPDDPRLAGLHYEVSYPPAAPRAEPAYPPPPHGSPPYGHIPYGRPPYGPPYGAAPKDTAPSRAPLWISSLIVLALAVTLTVYLLLRQPGRVRGTAAGPTTSTVADAEQVTADFFAAVDEKDEKGMTDRGRGDLLEDIQKIVDGEPMPAGFHFADGSAVDSQSAAVDGTQLAAVLWELDDPPEDLTDDTTLTVRLLDDGDGYRICDISSSSSASVMGVLDDFETEYEDICDYQK